MLKSPRKPSTKSSDSKPRPEVPDTPAKLKTQNLQGQAAKLANLKKAPSHQPKRKRATGTKPAKLTQPPVAKSPRQLDNWTSIPLAHRRRHERMTHIDA